MSRLEDLGQLISTQLDDDTIAIEAGKLRLHENRGRRRIIFVRGSGRVQPLASPGRIRLGTPLDGVATQATQRFTRQEFIQVTLRAEGETELDTLFDAFLDAAFEVCGPNSTPTEYAWHEGDSSDGGAWKARQPAIQCVMSVNLRALPTPHYSSVELEATGADVSTLNSQGATAAPGVETASIVIPDA